jgi:uncharacterized membrane protein
MSGDKKHWLDDRRNVDVVFWVLCGVCGVLVVIDLFLHRHAHYRWEEWPGFYAAFGFVAFWCIVIAGKHLRKILWRDEDYYD